LKIRIAIFNGEGKTQFSFKSELYFVSGFLKNTFSVNTKKGANPVSGAGSLSVTREASRPASRKRGRYS
jgi:hypothetical protein